MARTQIRQGKSGHAGAGSTPAQVVAVPQTIVAPPGWNRARSLAGVVLAIYLFLTVISIFPLRSGRIVAHGNETTWDRAIFTAINTSTLTGFQQTMGLREMSVTGAGGPILLLGLTLVGTLTTLIVGGLAAARILRMQHSARQIAWAAVVALLLGTLAGGALLTSRSASVLEAIFDAASAFGNSGLWLGQNPSTTAPSTYLVLLPLVILGGLGLPVLIEISDRAFGGPSLSRHSRVVLMLSGAFYIGAFVALVIAQAPAAWGGGFAAWQNTFASCSVQAINTRSAGIPFQSPAVFTAAGQWLLMILMLVGASPAGTGSGLKTTTVWQLSRSIRDLLHGRAVHRSTGIAVVWLVSFLLVLGIGILVLSMLEPQLAPDRLLFLACSAMGNVGLSHDPVSTTGPGLLVLSALMLAGRLGPLAILWWMAETTTGADVAIG